MSSGRETRERERDRQTDRQKERKKVAIRYRGEKLTFEQTNGRTDTLAVCAGLPCDPCTQHQPMDDFISRFIGQPCSCVLCEHLLITFLVVIPASAGPQVFPEFAYGTSFLYL
jgi:hypothetical protein